MVGAEDSSVWSNEYETWPVPNDGCYQVVDSRSKELEKLLENNTKGTDDNHRVMNNLLNFLAKEWDYFKGYVTASLIIGNQQIKSVDSSFGKLLLRSSWISTQPVLDPEFGTRTEKRLLPPNQVFLFSKRLHSFFYEHVPYLLGSTPENRELVCFLGFKGEDVIDNVDFLLDMLRSWCTRGKNCQPDEIMKSGAVFATSIEHMLQVYIYIQLQSPPRQFQQFFDKFPAVFLPHSKCAKDKVVTGKFVHKSLIYWMDSTELFHKYSASTERVSVIEFYKSNQGFFKIHLRIDDAPTMLEYLQLLVKITSENQLPNNIVHSDVLKIFEILGEKCARSGDTYGKSNLAKDVIDVDTARASFLKNNLKGYKVFPTKANRWVTLDDEPLIVDEGSKELEELFSSNQDINFLLEDTEEDLTSKRRVKSRSSINIKGSFEYRNVQCFLQVCELKHLSDCVKPESIQVQISPCPSLQNLMHRVVPYVQSFLCSKYPEVHARLASKFKILSKLNIMNFMTASSLEVVYRLNYLKNGKKETEIVTTKQKCMITKNFYVSQSIEKNITRDISVRKEVAKFFSYGNNDCQKEMQKFLMVVMESSKQIFEDEEFLGEWGVSRVQGVDLWEVEKVEEPKPIPVPKKVVPVTSENENTTKRLEKDEDGQGIYSWPPKSSAYGVVKSDKAKNPSEEATLKQWPPPLPAQPLPAQPLFDDSPSQQHNIPRELGTQDSNAANKQPTSNLPNDRNSVSNVDNNRSDAKNVFGINTLPNVTKGEFKSAELTGKTSAYPTSPGSVGPTQGSSAYLASPGTGVVRTDESSAYPTAPGTGVSVTEGRLAYPTPPGAEGTSTESGVDGQFQTPPNPHRIVSLSGTPRSTPRSTPKSFSASPPSEVQLIEEDITPDLLDLPFFEETQINVTNPSDDIVGRWGEELVYHLLRNQYVGDSNMKSTVHWTNEQDETGNPYDIEIHTTYEGGVCIEYVEVKATNSSEKKHFQISANEVTFAQQKAPHYHLYRVYNAGKKDSVKVCSLKNLSEKMMKKQVVLLMKI